MATWPTITDDDGSNTTGTVINNANVWTPLQSYLSPAPTNVAYSAANFTASSGDWTVQAADQQLFHYAQIGRWLSVYFRIVNTSVSVGPTQLKIAMPGGFSLVSTTTYAPIIAIDNGTAVADAYAQCNPGSDAGGIILTRLVGGNWSVAANASSFMGHILCRVV